jgi:signal transduction histidine kinase
MRSTLATKFSVTILGVVVLAIVSSLMTWYAAWRVNFRLEEADRKNLLSDLVQEAKTQILEGNNLVTCSLLDKGNPVWEEKYRALEPRFQAWSDTVRNSVAISEDDTAPLLQLKSMWADLNARRKEVLALAKNGAADQARTILFTEIDGRLSRDAYELCRQLIAIHELTREESIKRARSRIRETTWVVGVSSAATLVLGSFLLWFLFYRVLFPLRGMVADAQLYRGQRQGHDTGSEEDELRMMGNHLRNLMSDVSDTRSRLDRSRNQLLIAERLASVGKLAASVAHEIRNPLTAMKMWLFSIQEAVHGNADLERKLAVISEEIVRLDSIVRNFLEFSRPRTLDCQRQDIGGVIDQTLELLGPRFRGEKIRINYTPPHALPPVMADTAQIKQVLLNLLGNAADAMAGGGEIRIAAGAEKDSDGRPIVVVRICDTGPGMPQDIQSRIFEPFFTTKEQGTGLGLCIAVQVMVRHDGGLVLESSTEKGTTFAVWLPAAPEESHAQDPRS